MRYFKNGKFHCKPVKKNRPGGKKKKCVLKCDPGFKIKWTKMNKAGFQVSTADYFDASDIGDNMAQSCQYVINA